MASCGTAKSQIWRRIISNSFVLYASKHQPDLLKKNKIVFCPQKLTAPWPMVPAASSQNNNEENQLIYFLRLCVKVIGYSITGISELPRDFFLSCRIPGNKSWKHSTSSSSHHHQSVVVKYPCSSEEKPTPQPPLQPPQQWFNVKNWLFLLLPPFCL